MRDEQGRFSAGYKPSKEENDFRISKYKESIRKSEWFTGDIKIESPYIFNSWRSIMYGKNGKLAGVSEDWKLFKNFYADVSPTYRAGLRLRRFDKTLPFSKDNFNWLSDSEISIIDTDRIILSYNNEKLSISEWAAILSESQSSIRNRYHKHKDWPIEEILLGRKNRETKIIKDKSECGNIRAKVSKMCSSYKIKDNNKRLQYDLDIDWFISNIINKKCEYCGDDKNIGCDRIDNSICHIKTNVVPCCYTCNVVRNNIFTAEEMKELGKTIAIIKSKRVS